MEGGDALSNLSAHSPTFFLDVNVFRLHNTKVSKRHFGFEDKILDDLGDNLEIQAIVGAYFFSCAPWMSMIQKKGFYEEILAGQVGMTADIIFLILCMKLLNDSVPSGESPRTELVQTTSEPLFVSSSTNITAAPLASADDRLEEARQLSRAILALCSFMNSEVGPSATQIFVPKAVCLSALFALYEHASTIKQGAFALAAELELNELGVSGLHSLVPQVTVYTTHIQAILPYNLGQASPLICHCLYRMAVWILGLSREALQPEYSRLLFSTRETLAKLSMRWQVAEKYLKMLNYIGSIASTTNPIVQD
ncbi:hypothetical protein IFR04_013905 [Cadophora malorum]|uniref:Uncharacterized protein n=1 Tax=Cadophora malorum TaxID=108018 RepID=A0A8H7T5P3_9HELO|nr:hypothetical protein IFR04_013905 [Cadophora malorum]